MNSRFTNLPFFALSAIAMLGMASVILRLKLSNISRDNHKHMKDDDDEDESRKDRKREPELPTHIIREIHKQARRKASVRFLAMKKPMYDNIEMYGPQDQLLCTISDKKAHWYIRKNLAEWKDGREKTMIRLLFTPRGKSSEKSVYTLSRKDNICVSCGEDKHHMRHYVVPYCYRTLLPDKYKTHMPHDIVILCPECHLICEQVTQRRQKVLEAKLRKDPGTASATIASRELYHIRSCAMALLRYGNHLPSHKQLEYQKVVKGHHNMNDDEILTEELLQATTEMETDSPNPKYIPGADLVVETLTCEEKIEDFIRDWRSHFLSSLRPRYLPQGWSVNNPVHSDERDE